MPLRRGSFRPKAQASASRPAAIRRGTPRRSTRCAAREKWKSCRTSPRSSWPTAASGSPARPSRSTAAAGSPTAPRSPSSPAGPTPTGKKRARRSRRRTRRTNSSARCNTLQPEAGRAPNITWEKSSAVNARDTPRAAAPGGRAEVWRRVPRLVPQNPPPGAPDAVRCVPPSRKPVQRAHHASPTLVQHVRVDHRRRDVRMPEQLLHGADVVAIVQQMGGKGMAQRVAGHALVDTGGPRRFLHRALQYRIIEVMAANRSVLRVNGTMFGRKHVLPGPFITGARVLARERERQMHLAVTLAQVARVQSAHLLQVRAQRLHELFRQQRHPVFLSLALAHQDLAVVEIHILDAQPKALEVAQSRTVEQAGHQQSRAAQLGKQPLHLLHRKHRRQAHRTFRPRHAVEPAQTAPEHLLVEKQQRGERLPLGGCRDAAFRRQVRQEGGRLGFAKLGRVPLAVEINIALDPMNIGLLRAAAVIQAPDRGPYLVEQSGPLYRGWTTRRKISILIHNARPIKASTQDNSLLYVNTVLQKVDFKQEVSEIKNTAPCYSAFRFLILG